MTYGIILDTFDPRYSQSYAASRNRVGFLIENHIYKPYKQRVLATVEALRTSARILAENKASLLEAIAESEKAVSSPEYRKKPMELAFAPVNKDSVWVDFLSWARDTVKSDLSGADWVLHNYEKPIMLRCPVITSYEAVSSVKLPEEIEVETYRYTKAVFSNRQSEGRQSTRLRQRFSNIRSAAYMLI